MKINSELSDNAGRLRLSQMGFTFFVYTGRFMDKKKSMITRCLSLFASVCFMAVLAPCQAQYTERTNSYLDWDFRLQPSAQSRSRAGLFTGGLGLRTGLAPGWSVEVDGARITNGFFPHPSSSDFIVQKAIIEKEGHNQRLQLGRVRLPFGIYDSKETYGSGLISYPLARSDYKLNSVDWGVPGAKWSGGSPAFQVDAAVFGGPSTGVWGNMQNVGGGAIRVQTYVSSLILGASHWNGYLSLPTGSAFQHKGVQINGIDVRYTRPHLLIRGEMFFGTLGGERMDGWYLDFYYHVPKYQRLTLVARLDSYRAEADGPYGRELTLGARYIVAPDWVLAVNWKRNNSKSAYLPNWTPDSGRDGSILMQVYHKMKL